MNAFRDDLRELVSKHIAQLPVERIVTLIDGSVAAEAPRLPPLVAFDAKREYIKLDSKGRRLADARSDWEAVADPLTGLEWARVPCAKAPWRDALRAASEVTLCGGSGWRAPTIRELLTLVDYTRGDPAIDPTYFECPADWFWTATEAKSPSGCAWVVGFYGGDSGWVSQDGNGWCRAVRAGQQLGFGI